MEKDIYKILGEIYQDIDKQEMNKLVLKDRLKKLNLN